MSQSQYQQNCIILSSLMEQVAIESLEELSQVSNVSGLQIRRLQYGLIYQLSVESVTKLATALQISLEQLLFLFTQIVHPGDDFFRHVNGTWYDEFEMPADRTRYGAFSLLREKSEQRVKFIIDDLSAEKPDPATLEGKVAAYYNAYIDTDPVLLP